jgi:predicted RNA binding protein YcfA (HicA-like mRNA interferase family)
MKYREFVKILESYGFFLVRESKHDIFSNGAESITVAGNHTKELSKIVCNKIIKRIKGISNTKQVMGEQNAKTQS